MVDVVNEVCSAITSLQDLLMCDFSLSSCDAMGSQKDKRSHQ